MDAFLESCKFPDRYFHQLKISWVLFCQVLCSTLRHTGKTWTMQIAFNFTKLGFHVVWFSALLVLTYITGSLWQPFIPYSLRGPELHKCIPSVDSPVLVNLKTKMKVHYDGGQWYHMAENFLVQHSLLAKHQALVDGKSVWYNFDKGKPFNPPSYLT